MGGGLIEIVLSAAAGNGARRLHISVINPGRWEPAAATAGPVDHGLGLNNLRERLTRVSGQGATCRIEEQEGKVRVSVEIPQ